ncbi:hypothetical protein DFJ77DRAFT_58970 [Powellomyces hirtus]|nr:hypothetical protein DFJ77DRAFT_58970 [Powellomyces hirtus]
MHACTWLLQRFLHLVALAVVSLRAWHAHPMAMYVKRFKRVMLHGRECGLISSSCIGDKVQPAVVAASLGNGARSRFDQGQRVGTLCVACAFPSHPQPHFPPSTAANPLITSKSCRPFSNNVATFSASSSSRYNSNSWRTFNASLRRCGSSRARIRDGGGAEEEDAAWVEEAKVERCKRITRSASRKRWREGVWGGISAE